MIDKLAIIGVGLIGGSLARALRAAGQVGEVAGYGRTLANLDDATRLGIIDYATATPQDAVRGADVVVLAVPVGSMPQIFAQLAPVLSEPTVVTDVGSVKQAVVAAARATLGEKFAAFVPGHPLAGTEQTGAAASNGELFRGRRVVLTPEPETDATALAQVRAMWVATGADVRDMTASEHDRVVAASSHLPHALAYALVDMLVRMDDHRAIFDCAAGGFRDFTRIAASDPVMWRDIFLANATEVAALLRQYQDDLETLAQAIERGDAQWLIETLARARHTRQEL